MSKYEYYIVLKNHCDDMGIKHPELHDFYANASSNFEHRAKQLSNPDERINPHQILSLFRIRAM